MDCLAIRTSRDNTTCFIACCILDVTLYKPIEKDVFSPSEVKKGKEKNSYKANIMCIFRKISPLSHTVENNSLFPKPSCFPPQEHSNTQLQGVQVHNFFLASTNSHFYVLELQDV